MMFEFNDDKATTYVKSKYLFTLGVSNNRATLKSYPDIVYVKVWKYRKVWFMNAGIVNWHVYFNYRTEITATIDWPRSIAAVWPSEMPSYIAGRIRNPAKFYLVMRFIDLNRSFCSIHFSPLWVNYSLISVKLSRVIRVLVNVILY